MSAFIHTLDTHIYLYATLIFVFSLCIGSFLNVIIYRLPRMLQQQWRTECELLLNIDEPSSVKPINLCSLPLIVLIAAIKLPSGRIFPY